MDREEDMTVEQQVEAEIKDWKLARELRNTRRARGALAFLTGLAHAPAALGGIGLVVTGVLRIGGVPVRDEVLMVLFVLMALGLLLLAGVSRDMFDALRVYRSAVEELEEEDRRRTATRRVKRERAER